MPEPERAHMHIHLAATELDLFRRRADLAGLSLSEYIRTRSRWGHLLDEAVHEGKRVVIRDTTGNETDITPVLLA